MISLEASTDVKNFTTMLSNYYERYRARTKPRVWVSKQDYENNPELYEVEKYPVNAKLQEDKNQPVA